MIRVITICFLCLIGTIESKGQTEEETIQWLSTYPERLMKPCCEWVVNYRCDLILFQKEKIIRIIETRFEKIQDGGTYKLNDRSVIYNSDMKKVSLIACYPANEHFVVKLEPDWNRNDLTDEDGYFLLYFSDSNSAIRVYKAFKHLANLWGLKPKFSDTISIESKF